jgi:hypothetical protein
MSPVAAQSCRSGVSAVRSLTRVNRTWCGQPNLVENNPTRTLPFSKKRRTVRSRRGSADLVKKRVSARGLMDAAVVHNESGPLDRLKEITHAIMKSTRLLSRRQS